MSNDARQFARDTQHVKPTADVAAVAPIATIYCRDCRHWNPLSRKANMAPCLISMSSSMLGAQQNTTDLTTCSQAEPR